MGSGGSAEGSAEEWRFVDVTLGDSAMLAMLTAWGELELPFWWDWTLDTWLNRPQCHAK